MFGSHVCRDTLRSLLVMAIDEEPQYQVVTIDKSNYSNARDKSMLFEVAGAVVRGRGAKGQTRNRLASKAEYIGESPKSVQDLLEAKNAKRRPRRGARRRAARRRRAGRVGGAARGIRRVGPRRPGATGVRNAGA